MGDNPLLRNVPAKMAVASLGPQITAYMRGDFPFDHPLIEMQTVRDWWVVVQHSHLANVLGVRSTNCLWTRECTHFVFSGACN
jgi:hypothetical protein